MGGKEEWQKDRLREVILSSTGENVKNSALEWLTGLFWEMNVKQGQFLQELRS